MTKIIKSTLLFSILLFFSILCFVSPPNTSASQSEAIAIKVIENPLHYSSLRWYQAQNFKGSPQSLQIDGYDAVRNGRTVYVNAANIIDKNNDGVLDSLYTNIFIISYTQDIPGITLDVFGELLKNFKFNTNLTELGTCNRTETKKCLNNSDCASGEYCQSKKAKAVRDVKRLADLAELQVQLNIYKQKNNYYPSIKAGTYLANKSISTWSSWQQNLGHELGVNLPIDPINTLGYCPGYDPITCWNPIEKRFATDLSNLTLPSKSYAYIYSGDNQGQTAKYCAQLESDYDNTRNFNCFNDKQPNRQPVISNVTLTSYPKKEFIGYVNVYDLDNNPLKLTVDLVSPSSSNAWIEKQWQWTVRQSNFTVTGLSNSGQFKIYAPKTGVIGDPGFYKIRLTVDDGQGEENSVYSQVYDLTISPLPMVLNKMEKTLVIGNNGSMTLTGTDSNEKPLTSLLFKNANFNASSIDQLTLEKNGFAINGMTLNATFKPTQQTGYYYINVYALDPLKTNNRIDSHFAYTVVNNPPILNKLTATFSNNTSQTCNSEENCTISIDNSEIAKIEIKGSDPDGHKIDYSLIDDFGGKIKVSSTSGLITGLEKLNAQGLNDQTFIISVKLADEYCPNSSENECSSIYSFNLLVKKYCSLDVPESTMKISAPGPFLVNKTGETLNTGLSLDNCSEVGEATIDVKFVGESYSQSIVLVSDLSGSMGANITSNGTTETAVNRLKKALTTTNTGFLDQIYNIAKGLSTENFIKIGLVAFSQDIVSFRNLMNLSSTNLPSLKRDINSYSSNGGTNTLLGFNKAEELLASAAGPNTEKIIILMSDGIPGVDGYKILSPYCYEPTPPTCRCEGTYPNCVSAPVCPDGQWQLGCTLDTCYTPTCACGGTYPNCTDGPSCPSGQVQRGCSASTCYTPIHSAFNNKLNIKRFFSNLFRVNRAQAVTPQNQCLYKSCQTAFPDFSCNFNQQMSCGYQSVLNCDLSADVNIETNALKESGISIYTIYYNTSGSLEPKQRMCDWSSNNGVNCDNNTYSFSGTDINTMITKVLGRVVTKPKDVTVNSTDITDSEASAMVSSVSDAKIDNLFCGIINPVVTYSNNGYLEFSNLKLNYCEAKLHP